MTQIYFYLMAKGYFLSNCVLISQDHGNQCNKLTIRLSKVYMYKTLLLEIGKKMKKMILIDWCITATMCEMDNPFSL